MTPYHRLERAALADLCDSLGPSQPTLCEGWTTADLAAHLVVRESRPDASPGILLSFLAGYLERVRVKTRSRYSWPQLVEKLRSGPPSWSPLRLPAADRAANTVEFFIHHEDVRRAQPGWESRHLEPEFEEALWSRIGVTRLFCRKASMGVVLHWPDHGRFVAHAGEPSVVVEGRPSELLLFASGRTSAARVELKGAPDLVARLGGERRGV